MLYGVYCSMRLGNGHIRAERAVNFEAKWSKVSVTLHSGKNLNMGFGPFWDLGSPTEQGPLSGAMQLLKSFS